jgi:hypothetical protein
LQSMVTAAHATTPATTRPPQSATGRLSRTSSVDPGVLNEGKTPGVFGEAPTRFLEAKEWNQAL